MSLPVVTVPTERMVCPSCPWRERRAFTPEMGLFCRLHIAWYDAAPAVLIVESWLRRRGFRMEALTWVPTQAAVGIVQKFVAKLRGEGSSVGLAGHPP